MTNDADDARYEEIILGLICCEEAPQVVPACILCSVGWPWPSAELQKRADRADQSVLFFLAGANFWEKHAKNCAISVLCTCNVCICIYVINWC